MEKLDIGGKTRHRSLVFLILRTSILWFFESRPGPDNLGKDILQAEFHWVKVFLEKIALFWLPPWIFHHIKYSYVIIINFVIFRFPDPDNLEKYILYAEFHRCKMHFYIKIGNGIGKWYILSVFNGGPCFRGPRKYRFTNRHQTMKIPPNRYVVWA